MFYLASLVLSVKAVRMVHWQALPTANGSWTGTERLTSRKDIEGNHSKVEKNIECLVLSTKLIR